MDPWLYEEAQKIWHLLVGFDAQTGLVSPWGRFDSKSSQLLLVGGLGANDSLWAYTEPSLVGCRPPNMYK